MSKVFRLPDVGAVISSSIEDWQNSKEYGSTVIDSIVDPAGGTDKKQITSIPSPFARIDLVKTAFKIVADEGSADGNTIYHKLVSDTLDVAEIFFNIDRFQDRVRIIVWDKNRNINELLHSGNPRHRQLGETLKLFLDQDAAVYNFARMDYLYLLDYYKGGPNPINIIGGTSPATLFFGSSNSLSYVDIRFAGDRVFDSLYQPLYKRQFEFQRWLYCLRSLPGFNSMFSEVNRYLDLSYRYLSIEQKQEINQITENDYQSLYAPLDAGSYGQTVDILGFSLRKYIPAPPAESDFMIASQKFKGRSRPLVLPVESGNNYSNLRYTSGLWQANDKAPYEDKRPLSERTLPFVLDKYPYLTISDFLEPYIIRTVYPVYKEKFFDGNYEGKDNKGFLLPLKAAFFDYFDTDFLTRLVNGRPVIEIKSVIMQAVEVTLRIPVSKGNCITYSRTYYPCSNEYQVDSPHIGENKGVIVENQFGLSIYPFIRLERDDRNHYRVCLMDRDVAYYNKNNRYTLEFFRNDENQRIAPKAVKGRSRKETDYISTSHYVLDNAFDYLQVSNEVASGMVVPLFKPLNRGTEEFSFAVDFGTSNTHIEYRVGATDPRPFEINENEIQLVSLHNPADPATDAALASAGLDILNQIIVQEIVPREIHKDHEFRFPQRTVIASSKNLDLNTASYALADLNILFSYERYVTSAQTRIRTNLKWSDYTNSENEVRVIEAFFENLLLLMRNKVLLNRGDLDKTKLVWFYPSSMNKNRLSLLSHKWNELYFKYITDQNNPGRLSESVAPFYYFRKRLGVDAGYKPVISIDIGGGTTDVVIYKNNEPAVLTSFKFAANSIFGDAYNGSPDINGFIVRYKERIQQLLSDNSQHDLLGVLRDISASDRSEDIVSFFFSLQSNKKIKDNDIPVSFSEMLAQDSDIKIVFLTFYAALIYHVARLMKVKKLDPPSYITFSGTGSNCINILEKNLNRNNSRSKQLPILSDFSSLIFSKVYNEECTEIELKQFNEPKEITCKGGLMIDPSVSLANIDKIKYVLAGTGDDVSEPDRALTYNQLDDAAAQNVINNYQQFIDLLFALHSEFNYQDYFGINPARLKEYKELLLKKAMQYLKSGIHDKRGDINNDFDISLEETLFFYPLIGGLNELAFKI